MVPTLAPPAAADPTTQQDPLVLTYGAPAPLNRWQEESLPIGNGALGASIFGQVADDELFLNEKTLWTGGPGVEGYRYGNYPEDQVEQRHANLQQVREQINAEGTMSAGEVAGLLGQPKLGYGSYQSFGRLQFAHEHDSTEISDYERSLDLDDSVAKVTYTAGDVTYTREFFASHPDNVIVMRVTADQPGSVSFTTTYDRKLQGGLSAQQQALSGGTVTVEGNRITLEGSAPDNGLRYNAQADVEATGGTTSVDGSNIVVTDADEVTVIWSGGTDYALSYPDYRSGEDPATEVTATVDAAVYAGFDSLLETHQSDYKELFDRVQLDLDGAPIDVHTDAARAAYNGSSARDRSLETLYYQYGRYLLISSSREGSLPANLQGVWNERNNPPWSADYHVNINLQMNYWPALSSNLAETTGPYLDYVANLADAGRDSAENVFGMEDGWMVMNETTPYGFTGLFDWSTAFWFPEANAWLAQAYWWSYLYDRDVEFLRDEAWPVLKGAADFWANYLVEDPRDGSLVANPSYSPEHGPFTAGAAMSQQVATEMLGTALEAAEVLGLEAEVTEIAEVLATTDDGLHVGDDGLLKEWKTDGVTGEQGHRHVSHLYALFPGRAISPSGTPELAAAAEASLEDRGDGGTGWSMAWKVNFWAHLLDGDHSHLMLRNLIRNSTYPNLWDAHPPFQIDGNFGGTSGVNEMLVQNDGDTVVVLPALPSAWAAEGSFDGIKAWNDVTVGATWASGNATEIRLATGNAGEVDVATAMSAAGATVTDASGASVPATVTDGVVTFTAEAGGSYTLRPQLSLAWVEAPASMEYASDAGFSIAVAGAPAGSKLEVAVPEGWQVSPSTQWVAEGDSVLDFTVRAPNTGTGGTVEAALVHDGRRLAATAAVNLVDPSAIPASELSVAAWNTQERTGEGPPNGLVSAAVDGNPGTFWHSQWSGAVTEFPHYVVIDLGQEREFGQFTYVPRQLDANPRNGQVSDYEIAVATAGTFVPPTAAQLSGDLAYPEPVDAQWTTVAQGQWQLDTSAASTVVLDEPVNARYVKLVSTDGYSDSGGDFTNAAELQPAGAPVPAPGELPDVPLPHPSPDPSEEPTAEPSEPTSGPSDGPSPAPTGEPTAGPTSTPTTAPTTKPVDVYSTPGYHEHNGRKWFTECEPYSQTFRCRTDIWSTQVHQSGGNYVRETGWHFNNLSYLPLLPRAAWAENPLGFSGTFTSDDRRWRTECDTATTGRGGCRSYIWTQVVDQSSTPSGWQFQQRWDWVFNNKVTFRR
ncbi:glycosyl hydrolase family 95 catalytic domain-containing protein [Tessaracoccus terricola]